MKLLLLKKIYYRSLIFFVKRIYNLIIIKRLIIVRENLDIILKKFALI